MLVDWLIDCCRGTVRYYYAHIETVNINIYTLCVTTASDPVSILVHTNDFRHCCIDRNCCLTERYVSWTSHILFFYSLVHLLMSSYSPVMFSVGKQCFSTEHFRQKYQSSGMLRIQGTTGPFRCAYECLVRRSCHSINFYPGKALCELLYLQQADMSYSTPSASQLHIEKSQMPPMVRLDRVGVCNTRFDIISKALKCTSFP